MNTRLKKRAIRLRSQIAHKETVKARHRPGEAWYTRAEREIRTLKRMLTEVEDKLRAL